MAVPRAVLLGLLLALLAVVAGAISPRSLPEESVAARLSLFDQTLATLRTYEEVTPAFGLSQYASGARAESSTPEAFTLELRSHGKTFHFELTRSAGFFGEPGNEYAKRGLDAAYSGFVMDEEGASSPTVSITLFDGRLSGFFVLSGETYNIISHEANIAKRAEQTVVVYREADVIHKEGRKRVCATKHAEEKLVAKRSPSLRDQGFVIAPPKILLRDEASPAKRAETRDEERYIELKLYGDRSLRNVYGKDDDATTQRLIQIAHGAMVIYVNFDEVSLNGKLRLFLSSTTVYSTEAGFIPEDPDADKTLQNFCDFRAVNSPSDVGHLITGLDLHVDGETGVVGYAPLSSMCNAASSCGINEDTFNSLAFTAETLAHELGHNLGMMHDSDGNNCKSSGFVMAAVSSPGVLSQQWSSCSASYFEAMIRLKASQMSCLDNKPAGYQDPFHLTQGNCLGRLVEEGAFCETDGSYLLCPAGSRGDCPSPSKCTQREANKAVCLNGDQVVDPVMRPDAAASLASPLLTSLVALALVAFKLAAL